jgi:Asp-tRNA(Asn)/Glu-tRNA(Gln) amidotransferase A subunit family amidase
MSHLPNTAVGLRAAIRQGDVSHDQALATQARLFDRAARRWQCVTHTLPLEKQSANANLPLSGVGLAHKDIFDLPGWRPGLGRGLGCADSTVKQAQAIEQLQAAGALNLGALAMAEDASSAVAQTRNLPTPLNPRDPSVAVGGSSSGSGVAVAAGMVYASLGTDTAGSVRLPAMTCGVLGLKTTHGLISREGVAPLSSSLDSVGILARGCDDIKLVLQALCNKGDLRKENESPTVGFWLPESGLNPSIQPLVEDVFKGYATIGVDASAHEVRASALMQVVMATETGQVHRERIADGQACPQVRAMGTLGISMPQLWYQAAIGRRAHWLQAFLSDAMRRIDVLMVPLQVEELPLADEVYAGSPGFSVPKLLALHRFCGWVNYLGIPAISVPIGKDRHGRSFSVQLLSRPRDELTLLRVARRLEHDIYGENGIAPTVLEEDLI